MDTVPAERHYARVTELLTYANGQVEERRALQQQLRKLIRPMREAPEKEVIIGIVVNDEAPYEILSAILGQKYDLRTNAVINFQSGRWRHCSHYIDLATLMDIFLCQKLNVQS